MTNHNIEEPARAPKMNELKAELDYLVTTASYYYSRAGLYYDTRYCLWSGQSDDGRKNAIDLNEDPFPWDGASDTRVRLADKIIKERKRMRKLAFWGKRVTARPVDTTQGATKAAAANPLLKWLLFVCDPKQTKRELNLAWSFQDCYGAAVMATFWHRETRLKQQTVRIDDLVQLAQQANDPSVTDAIMALADPMRDDENTLLIQRFFPDAKNSVVKKFLETLRITGEASLPVPYIAKNQPRWLALRPFIDVFFDPAIADMQDARVIVYREFYTETELKDKVNTDGWDAAFVAEAIKHKGNSVFTSDNPRITASVTRQKLRPWSLAEDTNNLIEIHYCYYKVHENDATVIYRTIMHNDVADLWAVHEPLDEMHGEYPFDCWQCEEEERSIMESRGIPEIVLTWQAEQKQTRDFHADRMSMDILPPLMTPRNQAGQVAMGPAQQIERKRGGDYEFLQIPPMSQTSLLFNAEVEKEINDYFGRYTPQADPIMVQSARQELVQDTLIDVTPTIARTFALAQEFLSDEEVALICGAHGLPRMTRADIQGHYTFEFVFDVRTWDTEFIKTFGEIMQTIVMPLDRAGTVDSTAVVNILLNSFDPNIADRVQKSTQAAQLQDVDDEQNQMAKMLTGQEPPLREVSNPQMRLQLMEQTFQSSRSVQQTLAQDPVKAKLWQNRMNMLKFAMAQANNAQTGRFGVEPVLNGNENGMPRGPGALPLGMSRLDAAAGVEQ